MRKTIQVDGVAQDVVLSRRKGTRNMKITVTSEGVVRVSVPHGIPEYMARKFVQSKRAWIAEHVTTPTLLEHGLHIGKSHTLHIEHADISRPSTKVHPTTVVVRLPDTMRVASSKAQVTIRKACEKALLQQAKVLLPQRVAQISAKHGIPYASVTVKKLKSRWGACDTKNNLIFNSYLLQLDWSLIDYVICHELAHTIEHNHSNRFWAVVEQLLPDHKQLRAQLKSKPTDIIAT